VFNGYEISLKPKYKYDLKGKITLPATYNGQPVVKIGMFGFNVSKNSDGTFVEDTTKDIGITHVFFKDDETLSYAEVGSNAFNGYGTNGGKMKLKYIDLPASIRKIGDSAFAGCMELETVPLNDSIISIGLGAFRSVKYGEPMKMAVNELPRDLEEIGVNAFLDGGANVVITKLPKNLKTLSSWSLAHCPNVVIKEFGCWLENSDAESDSISLLTNIHGYCLSESGTSHITEIYIGDSVTVIESQAFNKYGNPLD
jgi:hypothetical protein